MPDLAPLEPSRITIAAVQFVGTNVEMTYLVDAPEAEAEARLDALLGAKLGLHALTHSGAETLEDGRVTQRFSVMASPLDRLFHTIGPRTPLTVIKHASTTLDLSETNLVRQGEGLARIYPENEEAVEIWTPWDVGKLLGALQRTPKALERGTARVASIDVEPKRFPNALLPIVEAHAADHGGVQVELDRAVRTALLG